VKETKEEIQSEARNKEELLKKTFEGERNVLKTRIDSLEKTVKEQREQITQLSQRLDSAYQKVQEMAVKAVGGVSDFKSFVSSSLWKDEQIKKQSQDKQ